MLNPSVIGNREASKDPLLLIPSHHYSSSASFSSNHHQITDDLTFPVTAPRFDSQYSLHEDVANFLNCVRLALQNPYTRLDEHALRNCIGFTRYFPLVDGVTENIWGGSVNGRGYDGNVADSQQKMLLWMQGLQNRIETATKKNLDVAALAFGPSEEAKRDRGVSGRSDVEAVRNDLEWWLGQHAELEQRLKMQKEFLKRMNSDLEMKNSSLSSNQQNNNNNSDDCDFGNLQSAFHRAMDLQNSSKQTNNTNTTNNSNNWSTNLQRTSHLVDDVATLSRSVSKQQEIYNQQKEKERQELLLGANFNNNNNQGDSTKNSRSVSETTNNNNVNRSLSAKDVAETLNYELLALQATRYRTESVAETREKLVNCVLSLGSRDYGEQKFVRRVTNPNPNYY